MDERVDQACERRGNVEIKSEFLAQLQAKAHQVLKKSLSSQSLVLGYVSEFVCKQP